MNWRLSPSATGVSPVALNFGLVYTALRVGIVFHVALDGVLALNGLQIFGLGLCSRDAFRAADQRITDEIDIGRPVQFGVFASHDIDPL
jgi:hypothetical protein